ncbi:hypothetical protein AFL01nite_02720 [Aeromicrobium flavum]|uniref:Uncharacterized protein n=1 Tax=Aeromicrobium flavum TaxID=416568 RepID=A0A512HR66_9ACTN|nr:peptidoglycan DD-metalloendopeptidase family protein [Aeromicrobium flavum]GEO87945.1 hypothetical protein AFL01nite_02720 [Aeromicrobium flavum]
MRALIVGLIGAVLLGPAVLFLGIGVLLNPAARATCLTGTAGLRVGTMPDHVDAMTGDGTAVRLERNQLQHAATIISTGANLDDVGREGIVIALMAALTESRLRMLANTRAHPSSGAFANDGDGGDHDSLGLFQMRPSTGWGTVADLMDPRFQARAFFGGPTGPHGGSPRGLLDISGWRTMSKGAAAQAVEVSRYPDRYAAWEPVAEKILDTLTGSTGAAAAVPETGQVVFPLPNGSWVRSSGFGMRRHPVTGVYKLHTGADYAAPAGTPIVAAADGRVASAGPATGYGNLILIEHTVNGSTVATGYAHMNADGIHVQPGDRVTAGQHIADVGMSGYTTGPHLHFEIRPGGSDRSPVDPEPWLTGRGATSLDQTSTGTAPGCHPDTADGYVGTDPDEAVEDPTGDGRITARMAHVLSQLETTFPESSWACWRAGSPSTNDHAAGRACDGTFGNKIGTRAAGASLAVGWRVTNWLKANATQLGVEYLIWQGKIWSVARASEGWRSYNGGGTFDPRSVTGGHFDHLHVAVAAPSPAS